MLANLLILFGITVFIWLIWYHWRRSKLYLLAAKHKGPSPLPIIGNALLFSGSNENRTSNIMAIMATHKSPTPLWLGQHLCFLIYDPKQLEVVLNHPNALKREEYFYNHLIPVIGLGLLTASVPIWKKHRKMIAPTFNQKNLDEFVEIFSEQSSILINQLEKNAGKGNFDIFSYFSSFTLDAICETAMGISINAQTTDSKLEKWTTGALEIAFSRIFKMWSSFDFIFNMTSQAEEFRKMCASIESFTRNIVMQKKAEYQKQIEEARREAQLEEVLPKKQSFLQRFFELSGTENHLTDTEILDEVLVIMLGGNLTSASINCFTLTMLGMHPNIQEKVYLEVIDTVGNDKPVEYTDLPKLKYTEMVIKETMRIFPVAPLIQRAITDDIQLDENTVIPAGSSAAIGIIQAHRDPKVWPNPLQFDPLRFLPEECAKRHPYSYLPFSGGPRNCIGLKYAMMAMKATIATVVRKYHIKCSYKRIEDIRIEQVFIIKPVGGYGVSIEARI